MKVSPSIIHPWVRSRLNGVGVEGVACVERGRVEQWVMEAPMPVQRTNLAL